ncbi:MAG: FixH family protein [Planctomycetaceae bacterium]|nr:FixH family protein [Planctomycetaceae bacterium]
MSACRSFRPIPGILIALAAVLPGGCDKAASTSGSPGKLGTRTLQSNGKGYEVSFETAPDPIPTNEPFDLKFRITPKQAASSGSAPTVEVDARMPAHFHGMNRAPKVSRQPDGSYKAEGMLFHMPGHWELYFDISQGGRTERAQVDVNLK